MKKVCPLTFNQCSQLIPKNIENVTKGSTQRNGTNKKGSIGGEKENLVTKYDGDINYISGQNDSRHGLACCYDQKHNLLFIGGGFDTKKGEISRSAEGRFVI